MVYTSEADPEKPDCSSCRGFKLWVSWQHQLPTQRIQIITWTVRTITTWLDCQDSIFNIVSVHRWFGHFSWQAFLWVGDHLHQPLDQPHGCLQAHWPGRQCGWHDDQEMQVTQNMQSKKLGSSFHCSLESRSMHPWSNAEEKIQHCTCCLYWGS